MKIGNGTCSLEECEVIILFILTEFALKKRFISKYVCIPVALAAASWSEVKVTTGTTRRPASADRTARAANFRRDLEAT